ncbi:nuclear transport factor 2 family protein [Parahaliea mediterranea]|uniref:nuclear transport factor 2 family protein n=1 Tax=Parahaliea mediterranea TaxID=651086 RepID=UPI000E2F7D8B|nr:nuclear transport factor 2 family protein [Parahaliea mediterranea]
MSADTTSTLSTPPSTLDELLNLEAIKALKYRYIRCMTLSLWDELETLLTADAYSAYSDGKYVFEGRDALMGFLRNQHGGDEPTSLGYWQVGMPEITLLSATTARGIWGMYHYYLDKTVDQQLEMFCYYEDEYRKEDGTWRICRTGYQRVMEQSLARKGAYSLEVG